MKFLLVYQGGIANIFQVENFNLAKNENANNPFTKRKQIMQSDFRTCENFALGLCFAGCIIGTVYCNRAGNITNEKFFTDLENAPFNSDFRPVFSKNIFNYTE